ncbi:MAG: ATP-binding protein [Spirochaetia bacterium]
MPDEEKTKSTKRAQPTGKAKFTSSDGKLRIGDQWNAIRIIALSQNNPLKAIAELVENSIDARAESITIVRGRNHGEQYIKVIDDGQGIEDFHYVATHIGDSIKRRLKKQGATDIQGEFGIGLLSFWTVGEELSLTSMASDGVVRQLRLVKDSPSYSIRESRELFDRPGTTVQIHPLLAGVKFLSGEKIQAYLASELRDRIARSGVQVTIMDRSARKKLIVEPRKFHGNLLHGLPALRSPLGEIYVELYLTDPGHSGGVGLYKNGTRVVPVLSSIDAFNHPPWTTGYLEGIVDASFVQLTPGTRDGFVYDAAFDDLVSALQPLEAVLSERIDEQRQAEEEEASKSMLRRITRALREAFAMLPDDQYGWLAAQTAKRGSAGRSQQSDGSGGGVADGTEVAESVPGVAIEEPGEPSSAQRQFFEIPGVLYRVDIRPSKATVGVGQKQSLRASVRDKARREIDIGVDLEWTVAEGAGSLDAASGEFVTFQSPEEPELGKVRVIARQGDVEVESEALITTTAELLSRHDSTARSGSRGLPGYTYSYEAGALWRSRYSGSEALITINSAHPDFVHAARTQTAKLRYVARLFAKEIVLANFPGDTREEILERMIELTLYMDENLR